MERENDNRTSAQRYVDILTEAGFKAVFGVEKNKDVLIDLLNTGVPRFTPEEKLKYEHDMMTERDYTDILDTCRAEGLAEGETKGRKEERLRIAKAMIEKRNGHIYCRFCHWPVHKRYCRPAISCMAL